MKPLLKWAGGKRHIADELFKSFPEGWNEGTYFEPFIGGAAMYLHLNPSKAQISDLNSRLVGFYRHVKSESDALIQGIEPIIEEFDSESSEKKKDLYLQLRKRYNESSTEGIESAILLYVINKLCFNGLYRENSKGGYNVPFGQKKKFPEFPRNDFLEASKLLSATEILNVDFMKAVENAKKGDFVYFDPPYIPLNLTSSFTSYNSNGFGIEEQRNLANLMLELKKRGIKAICSNSDSKLTREIYVQLNWKEIQAPRMVSARAAGRGSVTELVISNF